MAKAKQSEPTYMLELSQFEANIVKGFCQNPPIDFGQKEKDAMESIFNALKRAHPDYGVR